MVSHPSLLTYFAAALVGVILIGCAVPQAPTGGPRDEEPPVIVESRPPARATNVSPESITLTFSEYVERSSLEQAITITPPFEDNLTFDWDGRTVTVGFPEALQNNTTYLVTLRTDLRDQRGVQLQQPETVAFSTGPRINEHSLSGRVVSAVDQEAIPAFDIFAYRVSPDGVVNPLTTAPAYRTQTDDRGRFVLEYLPDTTFFLAGVNDQNRNYRPDPGEKYAAPPQPHIRARPPEAGDSLVTLIATRLDTVPPRVRDARPRSSERTQLVFNEPVRLQSTDPEWSVTSRTDRTAASSTAYWSSANPRAVTLSSEPLDSVDYQLAISGHVTDTSRNAVEDTVVTFAASAAPDTLTPRAETHLPPASETPYPASILPGLRLNRPVATQELSTHASVQDARGQTIPGQWTTTNGTEYRFLPDHPSTLEDTITVAVQPHLTGTDSAAHHSIHYYASASYGSISGTILPSDTATTITAHPPEESRSPRYTARSDSTGRFHLRRVPEGSYSVRAFRDDNYNGRWDGGLLYPYKPGEPVTWQDSVRVRARWETDLDTLRVPSFRTNP